MTWALGASGSTWRASYSVNGLGEMLVENSFEPGPMVPNLPRLGMQAAMPERYSKLRWYGRGPHESYPDRLTSTAAGIYSSTALDMFHVYSEPQESGNIMDVRWIEIVDKDGKGLIFKGAPTVSASAWPYAMAEIERARHGHELEPARITTVNIDHRQMGVGGDDSWGALPHEEFRIKPEPMSYSFTMRGIE